MKEERERDRTESKVKEHISHTHEHKGEWFRCYLILPRGYKSTTSVVMKGREMAKEAVFSYSKRVQAVSAKFASAKHWQALKFNLNIA